MVRQYRYIRLIWSHIGPCCVRYVHNVILHERRYTCDEIPVETARAMRILYEVSNATRMIMPMLWVQRNFQLPSVRSGFREYFTAASLGGSGTSPLVIIWCLFSGCIDMLYGVVLPVDSWGCVAYQPWFLLCVMRSPGVRHVTWFLVVCFNEVYIRQVSMRTVGVV